MTESVTQKQARINRMLSLRNKFTDRYFTILEAAEFLGLKPNTMWDVLRVAISNNTICKKREGRGHIYKFVPEGVRTLEDAVQASEALQAGLRDGSIPPLTQGPAAKRLLDAARSEGFASPIRPTPVASSLPNILTIDGIKYVRMDRIAEVLLDQL